MRQDTRPPTLAWDEPTAKTHNCCHWTLGRKVLGFNPKRGITTLQFTTQRASQMERQAGNMLGIRGDTLKLENGTGDGDKGV